jgi:peptidyl-prolyl cis-trans isomerase A (cyclophilin A)
MVHIETTLGRITLKLQPDQAPETVSNFLQYVEDRFYDGTIFHRVIDGFMIQGGGLDRELCRRPTRGPIRNEAANGLRNLRGTVAMARTSDPDSATSQFFINLVDNEGLNYPNPDGHGYAVFGHVAEGMDVVDAVRKVKTGLREGHRDVPLQPVEIVRMTCQQS